MKRFFKLNLEALMQIMHERNITLKELADECDIHVQSMYGWLKGRNEPSVTSIKKIVTSLCDGDYTKILIKTNQDSTKEE